MLVLSLIFEFEVGKRIGWKPIFLQYLLHVRSYARYSHVVIRDTLMVGVILCHNEKKDGGTLHILLRPQVE